MERDNNIQKLYQDFESLTYEYEKNIDKILEQVIPDNDNFFELVSDYDILFAPNSVDSRCADLFYKIKKIKNLFSILSDFYNFKGSEISYLGFTDRELAILGIMDSCFFKTSDVYITNELNIAKKTLEHDCEKIVEKIKVFYPYFQHRKGNKKIIETFLSITEFKDFTKHLQNNIFKQIGFTPKEIIILNMLHNKKSDMQIASYFDISDPKKLHNIYESIAKQLDSSDLVKYKKHNEDCKNYILSVLFEFSISEILIDKLGE